MVLWTVLYQAHDNTLSVRELLAPHEINTPEEMGGDIGHHALALIRGAHSGSISLSSCSLATD